MKNALEGCSTEGRKEIMAAEHGKDSEDRNLGRGRDGAKKCEQAWRDSSTSE